VSRDSRDLSSAAGRERAITTAQSALGRLDAVVVPPPAGIHPSARHRSDAALREAFFTVQAAARTMTEGQIVLLAPPRGTDDPNPAPVSLVEGGFVALTRLLAVELAPHGLSLNSLCPIALDADPSAVASAIAFLVSPAASYMTGALVPVGTSGAIAPRTTGGADWVARARRTE
jgi:NAD(P)-dependent dehydrogenase (short-subunit alcohol dehydrogenase family)